MSPDEARPRHFRWQQATGRRINLGGERRRKSPPKLAFDQLPHALIFPVGAAHLAHRRDSLQALRLNLYPKRVYPKQRISQTLGFRPFPCTQSVLQVRFKQPLRCTACARSYAVPPFVKRARRGLIKPLKEPALPKRERPYNVPAIARAKKI